MKLAKSFLTILIFSFSLSITTEIFSQVSIQGGYLIPTSKWNNYWSSGFGVQGSFKRNIVRKFDLGLTIGYYPLKGNEVRIGGTSFQMGTLTVIPITLGCDYRLSDYVYAGFDTGYVNYRDAREGLSLLVNALDYTDDELTFQPKIGLRYQRFNTELRYGLARNDYLMIMLGINI